MALTLCFISPVLKLCQIHIHLHLTDSHIYGHRVQDGCQICPISNPALHSAGLSCVCWHGPVCAGALFTPSLSFHINNRSSGHYVFKDLVRDSGVSKMLCSNKALTGMDPMNLCAVTKHRS